MGFILKFNTGRFRFDSGSLYKSIQQPVISARRAHTAHLSVSTRSPQFLVPLRHHRVFHRNARRKKSAMARVVVEGMPETAVGLGGGVMLNRRRSKARRRKRKELFAFQMCFAGVVLGLVAGLRSVVQEAGEGAV